MNAIELFIGKTEKYTNKEVRVLGIDLGTTNSTVAESKIGTDGQVTCSTIELDQPTTEGVYTSPLIPSVVAILPDGKNWVGEGAKRLRASPQEANLVFEKNLFYDTKNEMGLKKTYFRAPEPFNHPSKIGGKVLEFLKVRAERSAKCNYQRIAVTVPASFQLNQRRDTLLACQYAGFKLDDDDLLDEPTAALIDYIYSIGHEKVVESGKSSLCVVFDFGGGTCDVSVMEITAEKNEQKLSLSQLAVSRYHRLGGGDIDTAIVHECLIPQLIDENSLTPFDLSWVDKKKGLEPQLLGKAEALKIALSKEIDRLIKFEKFDDCDKSQLLAKQPLITCRLKKQEFQLSKPSLSVEKFEELLEPFLDTDSLFASETEFRLTQSIFAPLQDALYRAGKKPKDVNFCLMVGGSSLIPQIVKAVKNYFQNGTVDYFPDQLAMQTAIARGAALNALFKEISSRPLIVPVLYDGIDLLTTSGDPFTLVPAHTNLPFPEDGSYKKLHLVVPRSGLFVDKLRFEIVGHADKQLIFNEIWTLPENASPGDEITMEYKITAGKQFECRAYLTETPDQPFERSVDNPLVNTVNPSQIRLQIEAAEEDLRKKNGGTAEDRDTFVQLAEWYAELNQLEKALDYLRTALVLVQRPDGEILNLQGIYYGKLGDHVREEKAYREADKANPLWGGSLFNLALSFNQRGLNQEALETIEPALKKADSKGPYLTLKGRCLEKLERNSESKATLLQSLSAYDPPQVLSDWELGWYHAAAKLLSDEKLINKAEAEWQKRRKKKPDAYPDDVLRPDLLGNITLKE